MPISIIIIDDEPLARRRIRGLLEAHPDSHIVEEADNGLSALEVIRSHRPDLIFLDIQMPEMDGFMMLAELAPDERPAIIFTTAYNEYAIKAFDEHALDYLLKPFSKERFNDAMAQVVARMQTTNPQNTPPNDLTEKLDALLSSIPRPAITRLCIKDQGRMTFIHLTDILWIESAGNYAEIHDASRTYLMRETMTKLEKQLPSQDFVRISRSAIVRTDAISEIRSNARGDHHVTLTSGIKIKATILLKDLQAKLEQG